MGRLIGRLISGGKDCTIRHISSFWRPPISHSLLTTLIHYTLCLQFGYYLTTIVSRCHWNYTIFWHLTASKYFPSPSDALPIRLVFSNVTLFLLLDRETPISLVHFFSPVLTSFHLSYVPLLLLMDRETGSTLKHRCVSVLSVPITLVLLRKPIRHQQTNFNYLSIVVPPGPSQVSDIRAQCYSYGSVYLISFCTSWNIFVILTGCILSGREESKGERRQKNEVEIILCRFCAGCTWQAGWDQQ